MASGMLIHPYHSEDELEKLIPKHVNSGWLWTEVTSLITAVQDLKVVSIIVAAGSALGKGSVQ